MSIQSIHQLDLSKIYSYADYLTWYFEERVELIKGKLSKMTPAPLNVHQRISSNFHGIVWNYLKRHSCKVYAAPFDVRFPKEGARDDRHVYTVVQPDICVVCDESKLDERGCLGAPDMIVEIVSPHSAKRDIHDKYDLYQEYGVKEYWIIYPSDKSVQVFLLKDQVYESIGLYEKAGKIPVHILPGFEIETAEIFE